MANHILRSIAFPKKLDFLIELCRKYGVVKTFREGQIIHTFGNHASFIGVVVGGFVKYEISDGSGKTIVAEFASDNDLISDVTARPKDYGTKIVIKACSAVSIYTLELINLYGQIPDDKRQLADDAIANLKESVLFALLKITRTREFNTPETRLQELLKYYPQLFRAVSGNDIASYLRISPTYLCRLKKTLENDEI